MEETNRRSRELCRTEAGTTLGVEETGFAQVFTTYCLRRATGNAINGEPETSGSREPV